MAKRKVLIELNHKNSASGKAELKFAQKQLKRIGSLAKSALNFGKFAGMAGFAVLTKSVADAREFSRGMAEVSTIVDTSAVNMKALNQNVLDLSKATGKGPAELAKGLYQTISAGVDAGEAMKFLDVATRSSIAGVAETGEAVDLLTNVINAYGLKTSDAGRVSDIAFKTVEKGKTTFSELAQSMGQVLPFAAQLEVSLEDLFAATATLTKGGLDTATSATALKSVMSAIVKPTDGALASARRYGIEMSAAHVKSIGFGKFLGEVKEKTKGNSVALAELFPNVRGLTAILGLTGKQAQEFTEIQNALTESTGAMGVAFDKMASDDAFRFDKALNKLKVIGIEVGAKVLPAVNKVLEAGADIVGDWAADGNFRLWWERIKLAAMGVRVVIDSVAHSINSIKQSMTVDSPFMKIAKYASPAMHAFISQIAPDAGDAERSFRASRKSLADSKTDFAEQAKTVREQSFAVDSREKQREKARQAGNRFGRAAVDVVQQAAQDIETAAVATMRQRQVQTTTFLGAGGR